MTPSDWATCSNASVAVKAVDLLMIETAKAQHQELFDIAEDAPEEIIGSGGSEDIDGLFDIPLRARPWPGRVGPLHNIDELLLPAKSSCPML